MENEKKTRLSDEKSYKDKQNPILKCRNKLRWIKCQLEENVINLYKNPLIVLPNLLQGQHLYALKNAKFKQKKEFKLTRKFSMPIIPAHYLIKKLDKMTNVENYDDEISPWV